MTIVCRSLKPETCRYHTTNAATKAQTAMTSAKTRFTNAPNLEAKEKASKDLKQAEETYDATDEGYRDLRNQAREARGIDPIKSQLLTYRIMKAKLTRAHDAPTDAQIVTREDMSTKQQKMVKLIGEGNSDHFYDVYDKYEQSLKDAQHNGSVPAHTRIVNSLAEELVQVSQEENWLNKSKQKTFEKQVKELKYKGTFLGTQATLDNPNPKMTFDL